MIRQPYVRHLDDAPWEIQPGRTDRVRSELLIDADHTLSHGFSPGVLEFPTGTAWAPQHLDPQKVYLIRESDGEYSINRQKIGPNTIIYNPKNCIHGIKNIGNRPLTLTRVFPTDTWAEVEYLFE